MNLHTLTQINIVYNDLIDINNNFLKDCILSSSKRMSEDVTDTRYEDYTFTVSKKLEYLIRSIQNEYKNAFKKDLQLIDFWSQIHFYNESTNLHNHVDSNNLEKSSDISGVYYVNVPKDCGKLVFDYSINQFQTKRYYMNPVEGRYILFPSTLNHFVTKNKSKEKRISISFNFKIK